MINKGNGLFLFLVFLIITLQFTSIILTNINNYASTMDNLVEVNERFSQEIILYHWVKANINNEKFTSGIYDINGINVEVLIDDNIKLYLLDMDRYITYFIIDNQIYDYE